MSINQIDNILKEITCDDPVTRVIIGGDEVMSVNQDSDWEIDRIFTDYKVGYDHKELIVVFKRKEKNNV